MTRYDIDSWVLVPEPGKCWLVGGESRRENAGQLSVSTKGKMGKGIPTKAVHPGVRHASERQGWVWSVFSIDGRRRGYG
jgi:hypothetical protein